MPSKSSSSSSSKKASSSSASSSSSKKASSSSSSGKKNALSKKRKLSSEEARLYQFIIENATATQIQIDEKFPDISLEDRITAINGLARLSLIRLQTVGGELQYEGTSRQEASVMADLEGNDLIVYTHIKDAGNEGIWTKTIKVRANLHQTVVNRCLKSLEQKHLIKTVKNVKFPTRKIVMLYNLEPSSELSGGPWYSDTELDEAFIEAISTVCLKFIESKTWPDNGLKRQIWPASHVFNLPTAKQILDHAHGTKAFGVTLSLDNINQLLDTLIYDEKIEKVPILPGQRPNAINRGKKRKRRGDADDDDGGSGDEADRSREKDDSDAENTMSEDEESGSEDEDRRRSSKSNGKRKRSKSKSRSSFSSKKGRSSSKSSNGSSRGKKRKRSRHDSDSGSESGSDSGSDDESGSDEESDASSDSERVSAHKRKKKRRNDSSSSSRSRKRSSSKSSSSSRKKRSSSKKRRRRHSPSSSSSQTSESESESDDESDGSSGPEASDHDDLEADPTYGAGAFDAFPFVYRALRPLHVFSPFQVELVRTGGPSTVPPNTSNLAIEYGTGAADASWTQTPCGQCPVFRFCAEGGPVNADGCEYYDQWIEAALEGEKEVEGMEEGEYGEGEGDAAIVGDGGEEVQNGEAEVGAEEDELTRADDSLGAKEEHGGDDHVQNGFGIKGER